MQYLVSCSSKFIGRTPHRKLTRLDTDISVFWRNNAPSLHADMASTTRVNCWIIDNAVAVIVDTVTQFNGFGPAVPAGVERENL